MLNWSHAIIGFLLGIALVLYLSGSKDVEDSAKDSFEVVEVQTE